MTVETDTSSELVINYGGPTFGPAIALAGIVVLVVACIAVFRCKRPSSIACFLLITAVPFIVGVLGTFESLSNQLTLFDQIPGGAEPDEATTYIAKCTYPAFWGFTFSLPSFVVVACGLFFRTWQAARSNSYSSGTHLDEHQRL